MAVSNTALMTEMRAVQERLNDVVNMFTQVSERMARVEQWSENHETNEHTHVWAEIKRAGRQQEKQEARLWDVALQVANLALKVANLVTLVGAITKMAGLW